jgi:phospholipid-binding lipoprotein MlaA
MQAGYRGVGVTRGFAARAPEGRRQRAGAGVSAALFPGIVLAASLCLAPPAATSQEAPVEHEATAPQGTAADAALAAEEQPTPSAEGEPLAADASTATEPPDPAATLGRLDRFNMRAAGFNYWINQHAIKPVAKVYNLIIPKFGQRGIENLLINLDRPRDILNSLLQAKAERAGRHLGSFLLNTTLGIGGLFYVSDHFLADAPPETFSETLGVWGVPTGPYIVLPLVIVTDTSPRGIVGFAVDGTMHPLFWVGYTTSAIGGGTMLAVGASVRTAGGLNTVATLMPSPWFGSKSEWEAFEELFAERTPYLEKKQLYYDNQRLDVED